MTVVCQDSLTVLSQITLSRTALSQYTRYLVCSTSHVHDEGCFDRHMPNTKRSSKD